MPFTRAVFNWTTDTGGDFVDTGPPMNGLVWMVGTDTGGVDTGCDWKLETVQSRHVILDYDNFGAGGAWTACPRKLTYDTGGAALGDQPPPIAGDRLRLTINQSDSVTGAISGKFYVWVNED